MSGGGPRPSTPRAVLQVEFDIPDPWKRESLSELSVNIRVAWYQAITALGNVQYDTAPGLPYADAASTLSNPLAGLWIDQCLLTLSSTSSTRKSRPSRVRLRPVAACVSS